MKKAQWKQDPRERAFGKDPRDVLNEELTAALKKANDIIQQQNSRFAEVTQYLAQKQKQVRELYEFGTAYRVLRNTGVVMEHGGEFKHLQGEDMDKFFGVDRGSATTQAFKKMGKEEFRAKFDEELRSKFNEAFSQHMLYGTGATHVTYDDKEDPFRWPAPQKP